MERGVALGVDAGEGAGQVGGHPGELHPVADVGREPVAGGVGARPRRGAGAVGARQVGCAVTRSPVTDDPVARNAARHHERAVRRGGASSRRCRPGEKPAPASGSLSQSSAAAGGRCRRRPRVTGRRRRRGRSPAQADLVAEREAEPARPRSRAPPLRRGPAVALPATGPRSGRRGASMPSLVRGSRACRRGPELAQPRGDRWSRVHRGEDVADLVRRGSRASSRSPPEVDEEGGHVHVRRLVGSISSEGAVLRSAEQQRAPRAGCRR